MSPHLRVAAVDLGATSGRVMSGRIGGDRVEIDQRHRFPNGAVRVRGSLFWDVLGIHREVLTGIREVARTGPLHGIGIDSWAIDHGLLDHDGQLLGQVFSHRDARVEGVAEKVVAQVGAATLYGTTGIQQLPFNTIYQLVAARGTTALDAAETMLLLPDLLGYWLTGAIGAERTNASTTQLYDVRRGAWAVDLCRELGIPEGVLPPLRDPGSLLGTLLPEVADELGVTTDVPVVAVGSHDTASAVVGVPAEVGDFAYISSGTWSLVGLELDRPVLTEEARLADFTNEVGVDGTIRFLKNVMGLWVLSESLRSWSERRYQGAELRSLLAAAAELEPLRTVVDINDPRLLFPSTSADPMPERIAALAAESEAIPHSPAAITRCILDSLAVAYRRHVRTAAALAGTSPEVVHVVGGGSQNELLCQLTADACGLPVLAGPVEAAALGNVLVQGRALGADLPDLPAMRDLVRRSYDVRRFEPRDGLDWAAAEARIS
ncbi:rhamnulokinase family protein [Nocardioides sp. NPDC047086]|uniref:rhamnulokinase n=1 Tax=Nocardioides sp. NPDC047086 TaxID=3154810 RepID=UPI0033F2B7B7